MLHPPALLSGVLYPLHLALYDATIEGPEAVQARIRQAATYYEPPRPRNNGHAAAAETEAFHWRPTLGE